MPGHYGKKLPTKHAGVKRGTDLGSSMQPSTEHSAPSTNDMPNIRGHTSEMPHGYSKVMRGSTSARKEHQKRGQPLDAEAFKKEMLSRRSLSEKRKSRRKKRSE